MEQAVKNLEIGTDSFLIMESKINIDTRDHHITKNKFENTTLKSAYEIMDNLKPTIEENKNFENIIYRLLMLMDGDFYKIREIIFKNGKKYEDNEF